MSTIFHIATQEDWAAGQRDGAYVTGSLETEGFIHCSSAAQVESTANAFFRGRTDLLLVAIDADRLTSELRYEAPATVAHEGPGEQFPHLYGSLNLDAVTGADPLTPAADGSFAIGPLPA